MEAANLLSEKLKVQNSNSVVLAIPRGFSLKRIYNLDAKIASRFTIADVHPDVPKNM
jgi:hypothetical protein